MATARSAKSAGFDEAVAETLATRLPTKTRNEMSSLSDASVLSTLPRRTETPVDLPRTATASAASAPAFLAASTKAVTLSASLASSKASVIVHPGCWTGPAFGGPLAQGPQALCKAPAAPSIVPASLVQWGVATQMGQGRGIGSARGDLSWQLKA